MSLVSRLPALLLLLLLASGCRREEHAPPQAAHEHQTIQKTVWSDRFEVFLEHELPSAGMPTRFVTHVTDLRAHEPRREDAIRYVLRQGTEPPVEVTDPRPAQPGVYIPKLTFPTAGEWSVALRIPTESGDSEVALGDLTVYASHAEAHLARLPEPPEGITFLKESQWTFGMRTEPVSRRRMVERLRVPGRVVARTGSRAAVTPPLAGRLAAPPGGAFPSLGEKVKAGQTLAVIQPPFSELLVKLVESEAAVTRTRLALELAELTYARVGKLADQELRTEREREEADFELRAARAGHESALALRAAYEKAGAILIPDAGSGPVRGLPGLEIRAPIAGLVTEVAATIGEHVATDRTLMMILDPEWVHIEARVPESDLDRVASPGGALYEIPHARGRFHEVLAGGEGRVVHFAPEVDPATRTVALVYEVKNPSGALRVGLALDIYLETARAEEALAIPESAVVDEEGRPIAFVQVSGEMFEKRHLGLGLREEGLVEVRSGLSEGERVVTREAYAVRLASIATSIPEHGHAH